VPWAEEAPATSRMMTKKIERLCFMREIILDWLVAHFEKLISERGESAVLY
jgi:hypothetical protein